MAENQQEKLMRVLGCTEEEALDILSNDKAIDQGKRVDFDFDTKGKIRKENPTKAGIIAELAKFLEENSENACETVEITNKERQIAFKIGENDFELTLVQKRAKKS